MAKKKQAEELKPRTSFPITILPRDNTKKTLPGWRMARDAAESIYWPQRKSLMDLYREITLDPILGDCIRKRVRAVTNITYTVKANGEPVEVLEKFLKTRAFKKVLRLIVESKLYGFSLIEFLDIRKGQIELVPREYVLPEQNMVVTNPLMSNEGYDYTKPPFLNRVLPVGEPDDLGLLFEVAPYVILKKGDVSDWATYCEVFGSPLRVGKYDPNMPGNETQVANALKNMGSNAWASFPIGTEFEFIDSNKGGTGNNTFDRFAEYCESQIAIGIIGQTMTQKDGASRAQGEVHKDVLDEISRDDRDFVISVLNEDFIPILEAAGFTIPSDTEFEFVEEEATITKKDRLEMDLSIHEKVGPIKKEYFAQEYNIEFVDDTDPVQPDPTKGTITDPNNVSSSEVENPQSKSKRTKANFWDFFH